MRVRIARPLELVISNDWRRERHVPELALELLPETGVTCVDEDDHPLALAWLYLSNSKLAYLAWPVTKPGLNPYVARDALELCVVELSALAERLGVRSILSTVASRGLEKLLLQQGFLVTGEKHVMMSKGVN